MKLVVTMVSEISVEFMDENIQGIIEYDTMPKFVDQYTLISDVTLGLRRNIYGQLLLYCEEKASCNKNCFGSFLYLPTLNLLI